MEKSKAFLLAFLATSYFSYVISDSSFKVISCSHYQKKFVQKKHICSIRVSPLCATNNVTYPNSCVYCFARISLNFTLRIQYSGKCLKSTS
uniref:serine protease inhibitor Kazal-type 9 n=1 Tax=Myodes glareolus TaxID=447135 RepID=UPI0020200D9D|nr:serine protease inhibitor Kazal-type 9 [Myodes glareolus]